MASDPLDLYNKTIPELMKLISDNMASGYKVGSTSATEWAKTMLQFRFSEKQTEAMVQQAKASEELAKFTLVLVRATKALVFFGGVTLLLTFVQTLKALGIMR